MLGFVANALAHFPDKEEETNCSSCLFYFSTGQSPAELYTSQRRSSRRQQYRRIHAQELDIEVCFHHLVILILE